MKILNYTREPLEDAVYANRLAFSLHLAIEENGIFKALNHNSGVLFVKGTENEDGSINPKSLKNPWLFNYKSGYGVVCVRTQANGEPDNENIGSVILMVSDDLVRYTEIGAIKLENDIHVKSVMCLRSDDEYTLIWKNENGKCKKATVSDLYANAEINGCTEISDDEATKIRLAESGITDESVISNIQGAVCGNIIEISDTLGEYLLKKLMPAENTGIILPTKVSVSSKEDLSAIRARALYSDGSSVLKKINWANADDIDFSQKGTYKLNGTVYQPHFDFPLMINRADPCVGRWNDKYYYIATNDADGNHTLYIRCADSIEGLENAEEHLILDSKTYDDIGGLLWAPEFHVIDGKLYIFHAATPEPFFYEESHIMVLRDGGNPLCKDDWSRPKRVVKKDGSELCEAGKVITLDMTEFEWEGSLYAIWSQRQFLPKDLGAWLYIAKLNRENPWMLDSDPVVLSKPEYGWANNHTFVDEGPFALIKEDKLYITFSSAAVDSTYVVGLLEIESGKDLLDVTNWRKNNFPIFTSRSMEGEYGTGHNAYVTDDDGVVWNTYHARPGVDGPRSTGIRRVHFDIDGAPMLDVTENLDLKDEFKNVTIEIEVK